jgi:hypothetical protein
VDFGPVLAENGIAELATFALVGDLEACVLEAKVEPSDS